MNCNVYSTAHVIVSVSGEEKKRPNILDVKVVKLLDRKLNLIYISFGYDLLGKDQYYAFLGTLK